MRNPSEANHCRFFKPKKDSFHRNPNGKPLNVGRRRIIVIVGPTASGKTGLAIKIAKRFDGEIVSADSRQVYRGLNIGTGKVTKKEQKNIAHHLLDVVSPKKQFSVDDYKRLSQKAIADIVRRVKIPIVCGGTGLYIDALIYDLSFPKVPPNKKLRAKLEKKSVEQLFAQLKKLDPKRAGKIDPRNPRRLVRALEIVLETGSPVSPLDTEYSKHNAKYDVLRLGITWPKDILAKRIKGRLIRRLKQGMIAEVKKLKENGLSWKKLESFGLEYRWIARYLQKIISKEEMKNGLLKAIIQYSKRQMTWFRKDKEIKWINVGTDSGLKKTLQLCDKFLRKN